MLMFATLFCVICSLCFGGGYDEKVVTLADLRQLSWGHLDDGANVGHVRYGSHREYSVCSVELVFLMRPLDAVHAHHLIFRARYLTSNARHLTPNARHLTFIARHLMVLCWFIGLLFICLLFRSACVP